MRALAVILSIVMFGCAKTIPAPEAPDRLPISDSVEEVVELPVYVEPSQGEAVGVLAGTEVPFDGVLFDESKAFGAGELRIAYDELYRNAGIQKAAFLVSIRLMEQELQQADLEIKKKNAALRELSNSWWAKHKVTIGVLTGVVVGICGTVATGVVWSKID